MSGQVYDVFSPNPVHISKMPEKENALKNTFRSAHSLFWHNIGMLTCWAWTVSALFFPKGTARIFLLTKKNVVLADSKTGQVKASVPLPDLASVSVSTQSDGFFALKLKEVRGTWCCKCGLVLLWSCRKSELVWWTWKSASTLSLTLPLRPAETWKLLNVLQGTFYWL